MATVPGAIIVLAAAKQRKRHLYTRKR